MSDHPSPADHTSSPRRTTAAATPGICVRSRSSVSQSVSSSSNDESVETHVVTGAALTRLHGVGLSSPTDGMRSSQSRGNGAEGWTRQRSCALPCGPVTTAPASRMPSTLVSNVCGVPHKVSTCVMSSRTSSSSGSRSRLCGTNIALTSDGMSFCSCHPRICSSRARAGPSVKPGNGSRAEGMAERYGAGRRLGSAICTNPSASMRLGEQRSITECKGRRRDAARQRRFVPRRRRHDS